jgi:hypothetical protein
MSQSVCSFTWSLLTSRRMIQNVLQVLPATFDHLEQMIAGHLVLAKFNSVWFYKRFWRT